MEDQYDAAIYSHQSGWLTSDKEWHEPFLPVASVLYFWAVVAHLVIVEINLIFSEEF